MKPALILCLRASFGACRASSGRLRGLILFPVTARLIDLLPLDTEKFIGQFEETFERELRVKTPAEGRLKAMLEGIPRAGGSA